LEPLWKELRAGEERLPNHVEVHLQMKLLSPDRLLLITGPCQIETLDLALHTAEFIKGLSERFPVSVVYKSSYDKANRTSLSTARGVGLEEGLRILERVRTTFDLPVLTDVHSPEEAKAAAEVVDVLQIPAFLCRQTDLLVAAGSTRKPVNIKKGQFLAPADMKYAADKVAAGGSKEIFLCERGTSFGYRDLIVDMRSLVIMSELGFPVIFDGTHSVQSMGGSGGMSGGTRSFVPPLVRAACAVGISGLFIECHPNPDSAPSDGPTMIPMHEMPELIESACAIWNCSRGVR
jgi:2-dehydro-3-deoxyphosphooctonate aldolase (KDO 8-P synthase)